ncbi:MAG: sugar ABC transporter ATP-binding protein [Planctomycetota bacterium]|nr:sugar ABC transporter ATP-binding protein [Planctomycetota bacterium]
MLLTAKNISKAFGATQALDDVSTEFRSGRIKAVIGENGAGKSTLLKVICGVHKMDSGEVDLDGVPFTPVDHIESAKRGVVYVFQETTINPFVSVPENIFIDRLRNFTNRLGLINRKRMEDEAVAILAELGGNIDVRANLWDLDYGQWKVLELARALTYDPKVIFFDESTAYLNNREVVAFLSVVEGLKERDIAIGFVSHHFNEVFQIADTAVIMKDGRWVAEKVIAETNPDEVQNLMVGRTIGNIYPEKKTDRPTEEIIRLDNLSVEKSLHNVSFSVRKGEILGVGGLKGSGGEEIIGAIYGDIRAASGEMTLKGERYAPGAPYGATAKKIALLPGERSIEGLIVNFSVKDNITMGALPTRAGLLDKKRESGMSERIIRDVTIKVRSPSDPCSSLSGGNMQKVVFGKCLAMEPDIFLLNNPTRGIDVGARLEIYKLISDLSKRGITIILLSEDLNELIGMCDRTIILRKGEISKIYDFGEPPTEEDMIKYML